MNQQSIVNTGKYLDKLSFSFNRITFAWYILIIITDCYMQPRERPGSTFISSFTYWLLSSSCTSCSNINKITSEGSITATCPFPRRRQKRDAVLQPPAPPPTTTSLYDFWSALREVENVRLEYEMHAPLPWCTRILTDCILFRQNYLPALNVNYCTGL